MKYVKKIFLYIILAFLVTLLIFIAYNFELLQRALNTGKGVAYQEISTCLANNEGSIFSTDSIFQEPLKEIRQKVHQLKNEFRIPGLNICIAKDGKIIWNEAFGCTNIENLQPATVRDVYRIGSISKSLTAITLMSLIEKGYFSLFDPIQNFLPEIPIRTPVTFGQLSSHQSGIRHYKGLEMYSNKAYNSTTEALEIFINDPLKFQPGTDYQYSTYGYTLIAAALEEITGIAFPELVFTVGKKLQMENTRVEQDRDKRNFYTSSRGESNVKNAIEVDLSNKLAGGGFISNSKDLVMMIINLDSLLSIESQKLLFTPMPFDNGNLGDQGYGLGFRIARTAESQKTLIHHGGSSIGGRAYLLRVVEDDIVIAICTNSHSNMIFPENFGVQEVYDLTKPLLTTSRK